MKIIDCSLHNFLLASLFFCIISLLALIPVYAQDGSYSAEAQKTLDNYSADNLDVFKFSINNILNSDGDVVEIPAGNPSIFGRTDYGSEFFLENELSTAFSIEIPAFVINDLALDPLGEYFPVIIDGTEKLSIDFKDLYDNENGEAITPEMGFVKIIDDATSSDLENLSDGEIVEFFVRPTDKYLNQHNKDNLFFIDRAIPENPVVTEIGSDETEYETSSSSDENKTNTILAPGEEAVTLPSGEVKIYITTVYVPAPASKFEPSQIVMPVLADGDYDYNKEPAAAETFSEDMQVVAIPEEEAKVLSEKVKEIKEAKEEPTNPKHDEDSPPALDPQIEAMMNLQMLLNNVMRGPNNLNSETRKTIQKEFPNMSDEFIDFILNTANSDEKFDLIKNPREFLDNEFAKISDPTELNLLIGMDVPQRDLTKIYNLILYKFSSDLADLGFENLKNQKVDFSVNIQNGDQILEQVQLQRDILAIASSFGTNGNLSSLLIAPVKTNPDSSTSLFESNNSQKVLGQMTQFSEIINVINGSSNSITAGGTNPDEDIPVVEINIQLGENIADALQKKLIEDKRFNRSFQTRSQSSKIERFDFEIPSQAEGSDPPALPTLLTEAPNITDQELQLVVETTEATDNILDDTIDRMLIELGDQTLQDNTAQFVSASNDSNSISQENTLTKEDLVFSNALTTAQRLQEVEDIRAIFQILGIGS